MSVINLAPFVERLPVTSATFDSVASGFKRISIDIWFLYLALGTAFVYCVYAIKYNRKLLRTINAIDE